ncbi:MAG: hypothetical protein ABIT37_15565 [Luteolibacter sp.]
MADKDPESWNSSTDLARAILHDRKERRKWMVGMMMVPVLMLAIGLWVIGGWLMESPLRFLLWWGGCAVATIVVMIFAVYDALAVIREEREKRRDVGPR